MFSKIKSWWKNQTEYKLTEIEKSLIQVITTMLEEEDVEIYTPDEGPYFIVYKNNICRVSDACIKLFCDGKLVLHDITPGMAYKTRQLIRNKVKDDVSEIENRLDKRIIDFIKEL